MTVTTNSYVISTLKTYSFTNKVTKHQKSVLGNFLPHRDQLESFGEIFVFWLSCLNTAYQLVRCNDSLVLLVHFIRATSTILLAEVLEFWLCLSTYFKLKLLLQKVSETSSTTFLNISFFPLISKYFWISPTVHMAPILRP